MGHAISITSRDWFLLRFLAIAVRLITPNQLARWWGTAVANARRRLRQLAAAGFLRPTCIRARAIPPISQPIYYWRPNEPAPPFGALSYKAKSRYVKLPPQKMTAYLPSQKTLEQFCQTRKSQLKPYQHTHEVGLAEAFLYAMRRWPLLTSKCWIGEDCFSHGRGAGEKVEDAMFLHPRTGKQMLAVEFCGAYPKQRFEALHADLSRRQIPYLLF